MAIKKVINDKVVYQLSVNVGQEHWEYLQACAISAFGTDRYSISQTLRKIIEDHWNERAKSGTIPENVER